MIITAYYRDIAVRLLETLLPSIFKVAVKCPPTQLIKFQISCDFQVIIEFSFAT